MEVDDVALHEGHAALFGDDLGGTGHGHPDLVLVVAVGTGGGAGADHAPGALERRVQRRPGAQPLGDQAVVGFEVVRSELADLHGHVATPQRRASPIGAQVAAGQPGVAVRDQVADDVLRAGASTLSSESAMPWVASLTPCR